MVLRLKNSINEGLVVVTISYSTFYQKEKKRKRLATQPYLTLSTHHYLPHIFMSCLTITSSLPFCQITQGRQYSESVHFFIAQYSTFFFETGGIEPGGQVKLCTFLHGEFFFISFMFSWREKKIVIIYLSKKVREKINLI